MLFEDSIVFKKVASSVAVELITKDGITKVSPFVLVTEIDVSHAAETVMVTSFVEPPFDATSLTVSEKAVEGATVMLG